MEKGFMRKSIVFMLFGLLIVASDSASAQNACSKNLDGRQVYIEIANITNKAFIVNWVDQNCKEIPSNQQVPSVEIFSRILTNGHVFRVREAGTNKLLHEVVVNPSKPLLFIETGLDGSNLSVREINIIGDVDFKKRADAAFASAKSNAPAVQAPPPVVQTLPASVPGKLPIAAGTILKKGAKYPSSSGNHYLEFAKDGNIIVKTKDDQFIWGLNLVAKNFFQSDRLEIGRDGSLGVFDAKGNPLWSPQSRRDPGAKLNLTFSGVLQMVSAKGEVLWASDGLLAPTINVFATKANATPCTPEPGWAKCLELTSPAIKIIGSGAASDAAMNGVANVYTEMTRRFGAKYPKSKFDGFKVYMTNGEPWSALRSLTAIAGRPEKPYNTSDDFYRGFGGENSLWITEQMICKQGVKTRNATGIIADKEVRTFDQVIHEFGHSIDYKYIPDQTMNIFRFPNTTPVESFAIRTQQWFGAGPTETLPTNQEAILKDLFTSRAAFSCEGYKP